MEPGPAARRKTESLCEDIHRWRADWANANREEVPGPGMGRGFADVGQSLLCAGKLNAVAVDPWRILQL